MYPAYCTFKCGRDYCQNSSLAKTPIIEISIDDLVNKYINNPITEAVVMQGLEPFDSWNDLKEFVQKLREYNNDDIVIYTGYNKDGNGTFGAASGGTAIVGSAIYCQANWSGSSYAPVYGTSFTNPCNKSTFLLYCI